MSSKSKTNKKWSRKFDQCVSCDSTDYRHEAHGECSYCYKHNRREKYNFNTRARYFADPEYREIRKGKSLDWKVQNQDYCRDYAIVRYYENISEEQLRVNERNHGGNWFNTLERDNFTCQRCGMATRLVHHMDGIREDHSIDVQISLCVGCHVAIHHFKELSEEDKRFFI